MPIKLQEKILQLTGLAAPFFGDHRAKLDGIRVWGEKKQEIKTILSRFELNKTFTEVVGDYFEPETYLLRYPELMKNPADPTEHYPLSGKKQGKRPA